MMKRGSSSRGGYEHIFHNILLYFSPVFEEVTGNDFCLHSAPELL